jgi:hypothetical protein
MALTRLSRNEFIEDYWDYRPGQHVAFIEPTGGGKTRFKYQLLAKAMEQQPQLSVRVTIPKRRDGTAARLNEALGLRETPVWPPVPTFGRKPAGYALWPKHLNGAPGQDPDEVLAANRGHIEHELKACAQDSYQQGNCIHDADDIFVQAVILRMNEFFSEMLTNGRSMGCGLWGANQKPSGTKDGSVTSFFYNSPTWLFLGADNDERNRDRFGEIGGVDRKYVSSVVQNLEVHEINGNYISDKLVISKSGGGTHGPAMCIVGP